MVNTKLFIMWRMIAMVVILVLYSILVAVPGVSAGKVDYGISDRYGVVTPTHVFEISTSMLKVLDYYVEHQAADVWRKVHEMQPTQFTGKRPEQVMVLFNKLADRLDRLAVKNGMVLVARIEQEQKLAIPAEVYLMNGNLLDFMVKLIDASESSQVLGDLYMTKRAADEKTPSDVFALGELALRKVDLLLNRKGEQFL
mgnify:CR=1 FL=1